VTESCCLLGWVSFSEVEEDTFKNHTDSVRNDFGVKQCKAHIVSEFPGIKKCEVASLISVEVID
jgi:hypothetical protein